MKIFHFIDSLRSGGKERRLVELLKKIHECKEIHCELVLLSEEIHYKEIFGLNIPIHILLRKSKRDPLIFIKLYSLCKKKHVDIIHTWDSMTSVYASVVARLLKIQFVNGMITNAFKLNLLNKNYLRAKFTFPLSDIIIANSRAGLTSYKAPLLKSRFIHNGFNFHRTENLISKNDVKNMYGIDSEYIIGMVASFIGNKDYTTFLNAAQKILEKRNDVAGEKLNEMKMIINKEYKNKIFFLGKQNNVESIVNIFDIGVLATFTEGISNSIMEYMALAKPVVATDGGGTSEIVLNGGTGLLFKTKSPDDLAEKIEYLLNNPNEARLMGEAGRNRIKNEFSIDKMTSDFISLYKGLIDKNYRKIFTYE